MLLFCVLSTLFICFHVCFAFVFLSLHSFSLLECIDFYLLLNFRFSFLFSLCHFVLQWWQRYVRTQHMNIFLICDYSPHLSTGWLFFIPLENGALCGFQSCTIQKKFKSIFCFHFSSSVALLLQRLNPYLTAMWTDSYFQNECPFICQHFCLFSIRFQLCVFGLVLRKMEPSNQSIHVVSCFPQRHIINHTPLWSRL